MAQKHNTRVYKRVAGAIKNHTNTTGEKVLDAPMPSVSVPDVFPQAQFDNELRSDLKTALHSAAIIALPVLAHYFASAETLTSPIAHTVATDAAERLISGSTSGLGWNQAIGRDLQTALESAKADNLTVGATLNRVADTLGVQVSTGMDPLATQTMGGRALLIANNAAHQMTNCMTTDIMKTRGVQTKMWQSMGDDRVRPDHEDADGQEVAIDDTFTVGGEDLAYPGDPSASAAQTYNCRCVVVPGSGDSTSSS